MVKIKAKDVPYGGRYWVHNYGQHGTPQERIRVHYKSPYSSLSDMDVVWGKPVGTSEEPYWVDFGYFVWVDALPEALKRLEE